VRSIVTNPVYLGWWLVSGRVVKTDNHPALIDESTFVAAQEALTAHGRGPDHTPGLASAEPRMLAGLLWCSRHDIPRQMTGAAGNGGRNYGRYQCDLDYDNGRADHHCTVVSARLIDEPVVDVVLNRCSFVEYADEVLQQLQAEYAGARESARRRERELSRLQQEIGTLESNLALTRTPEQVETIFKLIGERKERLTELSDVANYPVGRMLTAAQVETVRAFLANIRTGWERQPIALKNEFLSLILERVTVDVADDHIDASIIWRSGARNDLRIDRPIEARGKTPWTPDEDAWLREHYATATREEMEAALPRRAYPAIRQRARFLGARRQRESIPPGIGPRWTEEENNIIREYVAGGISYGRLRDMLSDRTWDAIVTQAGVLHLSMRNVAVHYTVVGDEREIVALGDHPKTGA
jgi:hypothetical protein